MAKTALKYSPVQYPESNDIPSSDYQTRNFSESLRKAPFAIRAGIKKDRPIKFLKDTIIGSSPKWFAANPFPTGAGANSEISLPEPIVLKQLPPTEQPRFVTLQKWEGIVLSVLSDSFIARLINQTDSGPDQEAEFAKEEIDWPDHSLIQPGAVFYWTVGYSDSPGGQRNRVSSLRFRRLPAWNRKDFEIAKLEAQKLINAIDWQ